MWAIDPIGTPLTKHLNNKGTILDIAIETQKQFLYLLKAREYEEAQREYADNSVKGNNVNQKKSIFKKQLY